MLKHKELQHRTINDHKEVELELEKRVRDQHENYINKDIHEIRNLTSSHSLKRQEHIDHLRDIVRLVEENISKVASHDDMHKVEDTILALKKRMDDHELDIKGKDSRLFNLHSDKFNHNIDVDANRRARSDFETTNKNLADVRAN